jgi:hypothetical protein
MAVDGAWRWILEVKTVRSAGGMLAEAYEAAQTGFSVRRAGYGNEVALQGYTGPQHLKIATAAVMKQVGQRLHRQS